MSMKLKTILAAALMGSVTLTSLASAATIAVWNTAGASGTMAPATWAMTDSAAGVTGAALTRGPGLLSQPLANGFNAQGWEGSTSASLARTNNDYFEWGLTLGPAVSSASFGTLDFNMRRSAVASPMNFSVEASLDGFSTPGTVVASFMYLGRNSGTAPASPTPFQWMTTDTGGQTNGNAIQTLNLADDALLQNLPGGSTVTFRLYGWGDANTVSTNTVALGRTTATTPASSGGPLIGGTLIYVPEPTSLSILAGAGMVLRRRRTHA
jgi:hypothetical protein